MVNKLKKYHRDIEIETDEYDVCFSDLKDFFIHKGNMIRGDDGWYCKTCTFTHFSDSVSIIPDMAYHTKYGIIECYGLW